MYLVELYKLIEGGESSSVEFKRKFSSPLKIAKEMVAFANSKGGYILFGVDDDRKIIGVESEKGELELINTAAKFYCEPEIEYTTEIVCIKNVDVVVVSIKESNKKPHRIVTDENSNEKKVYVRYNDRSILASKETVNILKNSNNSKPLKITLGKIEKTLFEFLEENDRITVKGFKKLANISERRASRTLVNLVRAEVIRHHYYDDIEFFTLA
ncbi:MAG: ATP-binding protein [Ignavibacteria bacterium]|nr:ATP-binding protein [Ignavibacteria bacterium]